MDKFDVFAFQVRLKFEKAKFNTTRPIALFELMDLIEDTEKAYNSMMEVKNNIQKDEQTSS